MSNENDKSTPVPTPHDDEHNRNQSTEVPRKGPKLNIVAIVILVIVVLVIIAYFAGYI